MKKRGIFIAIEGTDGTGKKTQTDLLMRRLRRAGCRVKKISFPRYGTPSAWQIEQYLNGFFGKSDTINPYFASLLYAADRREAKETIQGWLKKGYIVIADRYAASNAGHQGGKIKNPRERRRFLQWLWKTEFEVNGIPKPDLNIILMLSPRITQRLIQKKNPRAYITKGRKRDGHERDLRHLTRASASYRWIANIDPRHFKIVDCELKSGICPPELIYEKIWALAQRLIRP